MSSIFSALAKAAPSVLGAIGRTFGDEKIGRLVEDTASAFKKSYKNTYDNSSGRSAASSRPRYVPMDDGPFGARNVMMRGLKRQKYPVGRVLRNIPTSYTPGGRATEQFLEGELEQDEGIYNGPQLFHAGGDTPRMIRDADRPPQIMDAGGNRPKLVNAAAVSSGTMDASEMAKAANPAKDITPSASTVIPPVPGSTVKAARKGRAKKAAEEVVEKKKEEVVEKKEEVAKKAKKAKKVEKEAPAKKKKKVRVIEESDDEEEEEEIEYVRRRPQRPRRIARDYDYDYEDDDYETVVRRPARLAGRNLVRRVRY